MSPMAWHTGPIPSLEKTIEEKDWFKGIVLSATWLERYGYQKLKEYFTSKEIKLDKSLRRLSLWKIVLFLYELEEIDKTTYDRIIKINKERNNAVHQKENRAFFRTKEADKKYEPLIRDAITCLRSLSVEKIVITK